MNTTKSKFASLAHLVAVIFLIALAAPTAVRANSLNLLTNPGFETGDFSGWTVSGTSPNFGVATAGTAITGGDFGPQSVSVLSGTYAGYAVVCDTFGLGTCSPSGDSEDYLDLSQVVSVTPGATDTASFWFQTSINVGVDGFSILVDGTPIALTITGANPAYSMVSGTFTTTDATPTIGFHIQASGTGDDAVSFDDFSVTTPEPSSMLLLGTGLLGLAGITWRKKLLA